MKGREAAATSFNFNPETKGQTLSKPGLAAISLIPETRKNRQVKETECMFSSRLRELNLNMVLWCRLEFSLLCIK